MCYSTFLHCAERIEHIDKLGKWFRGLACSWLFMLLLYRLVNQKKLLLFKKPCLYTIWWNRRGINQGSSLWVLCQSSVLLGVLSFWKTVNARYISIFVYTHSIGVICIQNNCLANKVPPRLCGLLWLHYYFDQRFYVTDHTALVLAYKYSFLEISFSCPHNLL